MKVLKNKFLYFSLSLIFIGILSSTFYFYSQYQKTSRELSSLQTKTQNNNQADSVKIVAAVNKLIELPPSSPTVFVLKDKTLFKGQPFFDQAKTEDVLLVYEQTKKAILYRPSTNKIVDITTININSAGPSQVSGAVAGASIGIPSNTPKP
jgi:hypothetical protein